jgi:hypothetical protein
VNQPRITLATLLLTLACLAPVQAAPEAPAAPATAPAYPLTTCAVSGDKLEDGWIDYVYKADGQPDRVVRLCCKGCIKTFKKDPAKYLKMIDDAAAAAALAKAPAAAK